MNEGNDELKPDEIEDTADVEERGECEPSEESEKPAAELPAELAAMRTGKSVRWDSDGRPGKWTMVGCSVGIVILVAALFAGSSLLRKTVWATYAGTSRQLMASLPGDLPPGERMRLQRNLDRFEAQVKRYRDDYSDLGAFQRLAREALEDRRLNRREVEEINAFLESKLPASSGDVPYSMP